MAYYSILLFVQAVTILAVALAMSEREGDQLRCQSQGDPPTLCERHTQWTCDELLMEVPAFSRIYKKRPIKHNRHGMGVNHAFSLFFTLRKLRPTHVIESGVFRGQGTYLIRKTLGPQVHIYCIDPRTQRKVLAFRDSNPNTTYFMGGTNFTDFGSLPWKSLIPSLDDRMNTLVVLDDHMSSIKRVQQMLMNDFTNLWYDDNWKREKVDVYSFNTICSPVSKADKTVLYQDNFGTLKMSISLDEHNRNVAFMQYVLQEYYEFPALFDICQNFDSSKPNRSCMSLSQAKRLWAYDLGAKSPMMDIDFMTFFPSYVRLIRAPEENDTFNYIRQSTTPMKLKGKVITSAGGLKSNNIYNISLS